MSDTSDLDPDPAGKPRSPRPHAAPPAVPPADEATVTEPQPAVLTVAADEAFAPESPQATAPATNVPFATAPHAYAPVAGYPAPAGSPGRRWSGWSGWRRFWAPAVIGLVFGLLLGSGITALAMHGHGRGDDRANFRRFGPPGAGFGRGPGGYGYGYGRGFDNGPGGRPGVIPPRPNAPGPIAPTPTPVPTASG